MWGPYPTPVLINLFSCHTFILYVCLYVVCVLVSVVVAAAEFYVSFLCWLGYLLQLFV